MIRYLHTDGAGMIWHAGDGEIATLAAYDVDEFFSQLATTAGVNWRVVGGAQNVQLALRLFQDLPECRVHMVTPRIVGRRALLADGRYSIYAAQQCALPRSLGGWLLLTTPQAELLNLATLTDKAAAGPVYAQVVKNRRFCKALQFIPDLFLPAVGDLTASILDPRWFIDPANPDRCSGLRKYLGLTPAVVRRVLAGGTDPLALRCRAVFACWYTSVSGKELEQPGRFLHRVLYSKSKQLQGWLAAGNRFVDFLFRTWMDELVVFNGTYEGKTFFVPELFFDDFELDAYLGHISTVM